MMLNVALYFFGNLFEGVFTLVNKLDEIGDS